MVKKRIVKDYEKLSEEIVAGIKIQYPSGFRNHLIFYNDVNGKRVSALPFETEDTYYLVRMTASEADQIIEEDDDYDESGTLREDFTLVGIDEEIVESVSDDEEENMEEDADEDDDLQVL